MFARTTPLLLALVLLLGAAPTIGWAQSAPPPPPQWLVDATETAVGYMGVTSAQGMLHGVTTSMLMRTAKRWPCEQKEALWAKLEADTEIITPEPCSCWKIRQFQGGLPEPNKSIVNFRVKGLAQYDDDLAALALQTISGYRAVEIWRPTPPTPMEGSFAASRPLGFNCGAGVETQLEQLKQAIEEAGLPVELFDQTRNCYGNWVGPLVVGISPPPFVYAHLCLVAEEPG